MAGEITFTGLSSNIDLNEMIDALVSSLRSSRIQPIENWKTDWETKLESISSIDTALSSFYTTVKGMDRVSELLVRSASSSDEDVLTATADSSATPGSYEVEVGSAIKHRLGSDGKADKNTTDYAKKDDELVITVGTQDAQTVTFSSDCNLNEMVTQINAQASRVTASVINDGSDINPYRLVLTANTGGASNTISIGTNDTDVYFLTGSQINGTNKTMTGTAQPHSGGTYTGSIDKTYTFTEDIAGPLTVGSAEITFGWNDETENGTVTFPDDYTPGTLIALTGAGSDGVSVSLGPGEVKDGDEFTVDVWKDEKIDDAEVGSRIGNADKGASTGTYTPYSGGLYTGTKNENIFTFTESNVEAGTPKIVGTDEITFGWGDGTNEGTITFEADYEPGTLIEVCDGLYVSLTTEAGTVADGDIFTVETWTANNEGSWTGEDITSITQSGEYLGTTNKTFEFEVTSVSGTNATSGSGAVGDDNVTFTVHWTDGEGNSGDITFLEGYDGSEMDVYQGVKIAFSKVDGDDIVKENETFSIDVWHPDLQAGQDEGLARVEKEVHSGFSDADTTAVTVAAGTFDYTYNGRTRSLTVAAGTTLTGLKDLINNDGSNLGVTASILNDGTGLSTAYHLVLSGNKTGAAYKITSISHDLDNFDSAFTETQAGQNAMIKVENYPSGDEYIQKSTNHITDVITGITLDLVDTGTVTVTVGTDSSAIIEKVEDFREAFNNVRTAIMEATDYDPSSDEAGCLLGNYAVQIINSRLNGILAATAPGFKDPDDAYINLQQLGLYTDTEEASETNGLLLLDPDELGDALDNDPDAVAEVFSAYLSGLSSDNQIAYYSALSSTTPGIYELEVNLSDENKKGRFKPEGDEWHNWIDLDGESGDYYLTGTGESGYPEKGLALHITYTDGSGLYENVEVRLKNGVVTELSRELQDLLSTSGPLNTLDEHYNDIIDNIEERILAEERRMDIYEDRLRQSFARLDAYMSRMTGLSNFLTMFFMNSSQ